MCVNMISCYSVYLLSISSFKFFVKVIGYYTTMLQICLTKGYNCELPSWSLDFILTNKMSANVADV